MSGTYVTRKPIFNVGAVETHVLLPLGLGEFTFPTSIVRECVDEVKAKLDAIDATETKPAPLKPKQ